MNIQQDYYRRDASIQELALTQSIFAMLPLMEPTLENTIDLEMDHVVNIERQPEQSAPIPPYRPIFRYFYNRYPSN